MPLIASSIIQQARETDQSFVEVRHPEGVLLRALARIQRRLIGQLVRVDRRAVTATFEVTLPLASFAAGEALEDPPGTAIDITAVHVPLDLWRRGETEADPLYMIDWTDRHRLPFQHAAFVRGQRIYLTGTEELWSDVERIVLTYTPTPQTVAIDGTLVLPITAEEVLVRQLSDFMAGRSRSGELVRPRAEYRDEANAAELAWLDEVRRRLGVTVSQTREVW